MKVLLDACTPVQVRAALLRHEVHTAAKMGWDALANGDLLREAEAAGFELLIICDKNLRHQQNLAGRRLAILELWTNHRPTLTKLCLDPASRGGNTRGCLSGHRATVGYFFALARRQLRAMPGRDGALRCPSAWQSSLSQARSMGRVSNDISR